MQLILVLFILLIPASLWAQTLPQDIETPALQQLAAMASCMQDIDQKRLQEYQQENLALAAKLQDLCANGKRDQAQQMVLDYHKKLDKDPLLKAIDACMNMVENDAAEGTENEASDPEGDRHICDEF
jgi:hypothetical protein